MFYDLEDKKVKNLGENWSASNASIIGDVTLEKNTSIWFNVTIRGDVENIYVGEGSNIQDGSVLHTDPGYPLKIGKDVTIGHLVMLHGCTIEDNSLIGIGAVILNGAKIAYETIITDFSDNDNKLTTSKPLLNNEIYNQFNDALKERSQRGHYAEITFIGINSAIIKEHKKIDKILNVTVDFIAEVITCIKDKDKKIISGDPEKIKKIYDTWVFSRDITSANPNWQLVNTLT
jgi:NDP-sugar pyrophosphorylase family protein